MMKSPYSCSLVNTLPEIGLQLVTKTNFTRSAYFGRYVDVKCVDWAECEHCGIVFIYTKSDKNHKQRFCSRSCSRKHIIKLKRDAFQKIIYKNLDKQKFSEFYKKYTGYVYAKITEYDNDYREDFIEWWQEKAAYCYYKISSFEKAMKRETYHYSFLNKALAYAFLEIKRKKNKEVFYDECSIKIQQKILGTGNYED